MAPTGAGMPLPPVVSIPAPSLPAYVPVAAPAAVPAAAPAQRIFNLGAVINRFGFDVSKADECERHILNVAQLYIDQTITNIMTNPNTIPTEIMKGRQFLELCDAHGKSCPQYNVNIGPITGYIRWILTQAPSVMLNALSALMRFQ